MAAPTRITPSNYTTLLVESTQGRSGTPDGNIFFDYSSSPPTIEIITLSELATVDLGSGAEANPLTDDLGIEGLALFAFEALRRSANESNRLYDPMMRADFGPAGAVAMVNGAVIASADVSKVRGTGMEWRASSGSVNRVYHGIQSAGDPAVGAASQPYYQLVAAPFGETQEQAAAAVDFGRAGPIDEMVQVFGTTANGDTGAGDFDSRTARLYLKNRPFGASGASFFAETLSSDLNITSLDNIRQGYPLAERPNTDNDFDLADVFGGAAVAPFSGMGFLRETANGYDPGFNEGSGNFTETVDGNNATILQIRAFMDALAIQDTDVDDGAGTYIGKRGPELYSLDNQGRVVTRAGLRIINLPTAEQQSVVFTASDASTRTFPFNPEVRINLGPNVIGDADAWVAVTYLDGAGSADDNTANAVRVQDVDAVDQNFNVAAAFAAGDIVLLPSGDYELRFAYGFDVNTQAGLSAGVDKQVVARCEGREGAGAAKTAFTITRQAVVQATCAPGAQTNI